MEKIIAIGGGEIGRPGQPVETTKIDREIIKLSGKKSPTLLFIPTASNDSSEYIDTVKKHFGTRLNCKVKILKLVNEKPALKELKTKILGSDIIYVGGGNTKKMLAIWEKHGIPSLLAQAHKNGVVLSGLSAGAICWFKYGSSDYLSFNIGKRKSTEYRRIRGLNFVPFTVSPHHVREPKRKKALMEIMKKTPGMGIALDDLSAIEIVDNTFRIINAKPSAKAYKVYKHGAKVLYKEIPKTKKFLPLASIQKN